MQLQVAPIHAERLDLVWLSPALIDATLAGDLPRAARLLGCPLPPGWPGDDAALLRLRRDQMRRDPAAAPWLLRALVVRGPAQKMIGHINFHGPPDADGTVELGYTVLPARRRQGYATEAVRAMCAWAAREHPIRRYRLAISPANEPSLALARKLGFRHTGSQWDEEDGEELLFERDTPP